jgi:hypothetical protein
MARRSLGTLTLELIAKLGGFEQGMDKAARISDRQLKRIKETSQKVGAAIGAAFAGGAAALSAMVVHAANGARELQSLAQASNTSAKDIQRITYASRDYGVQQDKVADILKDVNDKVGEFLSTGGGPLIDFFRNVAPLANVTADSFRGLSGSDALQLYVSSLEKANLSQSQMTFYLEAIASDSTKLLPLLRNNGAELQRMAAQGERLGAIIDDIQINNLAKAHDAIRVMQDAIHGTANEIVVSLAPAIATIAKQISDPKFQSGVESIANMVASLVRLSASGITKLGEITDADKLSDAVTQVKSLSYEIEKYQRNGSIFRVFGQDTDKVLSELQEKTRKAKAELGDLTHSLVQAAIGINMTPLSGADVQVPLRLPASANPPSKPAAQAAKEQKNQVDEMIKALADQAATLGYNERAMDLYRAAAIGATSAQIDLINRLHDNIDAYNEAQKATEDYQRQQEELQQMLSKFQDAPQFAGLDAVVGGAYSELSRLDDTKKEIEKWYDTQLKLLDESRRQRADQNETWNEKEQQIEQQHQDKLLAIERARQLARVDILSQTFGNISVLSESSNKELAAIGKAAAIAQATIDGIVAVQKALAAAPPPLNFALAGAVGIASAANVAKIAGIGFAQGGYTGDIDRQKVAGVVHGREFVVNADATSRYRDILEAINAGVSIDTAAPRLPESGRAALAALSDTPRIVNNAPGVTLRVADGVLTVDMVPELVSVATGRAQIIAAQDAQQNGPVTQAANARTGSRRLPVVAGRR